MIIEVTDLAREELDKILEDKKTDKHLKIYVAGHGWGGPSFGMALEEPAEDDLKLEVDGYKFLVADGLEEAYDKFLVSYSDNPLKKSFTIQPQRKKKKKNRLS